MLSLRTACKRRHRDISHEGVRSDSQTLRSAADIKGEARAKLCQNCLTDDLQAIVRLRKSTMAGIHITAACCNAGRTASQAHSMPQCSISKAAFRRSATFA